MSKKNVCIGQRISIWIPGPIVLTSASVNCSQWWLWLCHPGIYSWLVRHGQRGGAYTSWESASTIKILLFVWAAWEFSSRHQPQSHVNYTVCSFKPFNMQSYKMSLVTFLCTSMFTFSLNTSFIGQLLPRKWLCFSNSIPPVFKILVIRRETLNIVVLKTHKKCPIIVSDIKK